MKTQTNKQLLNYAAYVYNNRSRKENRVEKALLVGYYATIVKADLSPQQRQAGEWKVIVEQETGLSMHTVAKFMGLANCRPEWTVAAVKRKADMDEFMQSGGFAELFGA